MNEFEIWSKIYQLENELSALKTQEWSGGGGAIDFIFIPISYATIDGADGIVSPEIHFPSGVVSEGYGYAALPNVTGASTVYAVFSVHEAGTIDYDNWVTWNGLSGAYENDTGLEAEQIVHVSGTIYYHKVSGIAVAGGLGGKYIQPYIYTYSTNTAGIYMIGWIVEW